jgi:hypothetical protein
MDRKTARKYLRAGRLPSELPQLPRSRTRVDAFEEVWGELKELLEVNAGLEAKTLFDYLQRRCFESCQPKRAPYVISL